MCDISDYFYIQQIKLKSEKNFIETSIQMDNFGFQTQGKNYSQFRPKYPECIYNYTLAKIKNRNRYLDVAMGTGQLLFSIAPKFAYSKGIDISPKMLETSIKLLQTEFKHLKGKVQIQKSDVINLHDKETYDLITIGQALHWFPVRETLMKLKTLLHPEGKLLVLSYVLKGLEDQQENGKYEQFYSKVKPCFDFDRNELHNHYSDKEKYPFEEVFPSVVRHSEEVQITMRKDVYVNYLRTYSGYNQYLLQNPKEDPLVQVGEEKEKQVRLVFDYFKIQCGV